MFSKLTFPALMTMALLATACGSSPAPASSSVPAATPTVVMQPTASLMPTIAATSTSTPQAAPTATAQVAKATLQPAAIALTYKGIEQGLTSDGFPYLGRADAPLTLTDYSDFL